MEIKTRSFIPKTWELPEAIKRRLGEQAGRQRLMDEDGHLLLILHAPPSPEDDEMRKPVVFWCNPQGVWRATGTGNGLVALEDHLQQFRARMRSLDAFVEAARAPREFFQVMRAIPPLHRTARNLLVVMEEARDARPDMLRLIVLRDMAVDIERGMELLAHDAKNGMDFALAEAGEAQAQEAREATLEARRLNRMAAVFFPLATLTGIFGMNEPESIMAMPGFWLIISLGVGIGALLGLSIRRSHVG